MARSTILKVKNTTGSDLPRSAVVYISGFDATDQLPTVALADNRSDTTMPAVGVVRELIANGAIGVVKNTGALDGFDTINYLSGSDAFVGQGGGVVFGENPGTQDEDLITQQIGTITVSAEYPNGQVQLFPVEVSRRVSHNSLTDVETDQHHTQLHSYTHTDGGIDEITHSQLGGLDEDAHDQYILVDGYRSFTGTVGGITPTADDHLTTKGYVDDRFVDKSDWLQNGFLFNFALPTMSFDDGTLTFTITPDITAGVFKYIHEGILYIKSAPESIAITDTEGICVIYYDGATLSRLHAPTHSQYESMILENVWVAAVYWDATNNTGLLFDERHGSSMAPATHLYLHETIRTRWESGLAIGDILADASGALDTHAQFSVGAGVIHDEDLVHTTNAIASTVGLKIFYRSGANWRWTTNAGFSILTTGTGRMAWDNAGTLTEVTNNDFALCHIFATNEYAKNPVAIVGQAVYTTLSSARTGADTEIGSLVLSGLPSVEWKPIGTVIYQTSNTYANDVKSRIRSDGSGNDYVDWRTNPLSSGVSATDHGNLAGLADDDHTQYFLADGSRVLSGSLKFDGTTVDYPAIDRADDRIVIKSADDGYGQLQTGGFIGNLTAVSTGTVTYITLPTDYVIATYRSNKGTGTITLGSACEIPGRVTIITDAAGLAATNNQTINTQSGKAIVSGTTPIGMNRNYQTRTLIYLGSEWLMY